MALCIFIKLYIFTNIIIIMVTTLDSYYLSTRVHVWSNRNFLSGDMGEIMERKELGYVHMQTFSWLDMAMIQRCWGIFCSNSSAYKLKLVWWQHCWGSKQQKWLLCVFNGKMADLAFSIRIVFVVTDINTWKPLRDGFTVKWPETIWRKHM